METLNNIFVVLILALICSLLSFLATIGIGFVLVIGHCYAVGIEVAALALVLLAVLVIFYLRLAGDDAIAVILTPIAYAFQVPCAVPMGLGLLSGPSSVFASICGTIFYFFMMVVKEQATVLQNIDKTEIANKLQILIDGLIKNQLLWITIMASVAMILIVYSLRRMVANYTWQMAIVAGGLSYLIIMEGAALLMNMGTSILALVLQILVVVAMMFVLKFFVFNLDYTRTESLQYEDDEYYYYVKAIPKMTIARKRRSVKMINEDDSKEHEDG